jgi:high frequency lysogenization protein
LNRLENQVLALAGMFQAAVVVDELAFSGSLDERAFDASLNSLFTFEAESPQDIFGGADNLGRGYRAVSDYLGGELRSGSRNIAHYVLSMMKIALRLARDGDLSSTIIDRLRSIERSGSDFELSRSAVVIKIDGLYQDTISDLSPRIMVAGEENYLLNSETAARVRTLLLAGIRAAVLWRQLGGSKWKLLFSRKQYLAVARKLAADC